MLPDGYFQKQYFLSEYWPDYYWPVLGKHSINFLDTTISFVSLSRSTKSNTATRTLDDTNNMVIHSNSNKLSIDFITSRRVHSK